MKRVSIVTGTYNSQLYIQELYNSIVAQTYSNWEWCVTDDASTDQTQAILTKIAKNDKRVRVNFLSENLGAGGARNKSLDMCKGDFIAFIDSDDTWSPDKLDIQIRHMEENNVDISFTGYSIRRENGEDTGQEFDCSTKKQKFSYNDLILKKITFCCSTVVMNKQKFGNLRFSSRRNGQDYVLWLSILKTGHEASLISLPLTSYRKNPNGISRNKFKKALGQWMIYRNEENLPFLYSCWAFSNYAVRAIIR